MGETWNYFGTTVRGLLTMMSMAFGEWFEITRFVVDNHSEWWLLLFVPHQFLVGFAAFTVIQGVFINETFRQSETNDSIMVRRVIADKERTKKQMEHLYAIMTYQHGDTGGVNGEQFKEIMEGRVVKDWLYALGLDV